jgi:hypothetical protein
MAWISDSESHGFFFLAGSDFNNFPAVKELNHSVEPSWPFQDGSIEASRIIGCCNYDDTIS